MATDWSITHSPTPRYLSIHLDTSLFSPATLSVLKLGLGDPATGHQLESWPEDTAKAAQYQTLTSILSTASCQQERRRLEGDVVSDPGGAFKGVLRRTENGIEGVVCQSSDL